MAIMIMSSFKLMNFISSIFVTLAILQDMRQVSVVMTVGCGNHIVSLTGNGHYSGDQF